MMGVAGIQGDQRTTMPDLSEQQRLEGLYEKLRLKLLDLSKKKPDAELQPRRPVAAVSAGRR